jgi:hypothetical protein
MPNMPRSFADIPINYAAIEALNLEPDARAHKLGLIISSNSTAMANSSSPDLRRMWLDDGKLQLSSTVLGAGSMGQVVAGTYEGSEVSTYCSGCSCTVK